MQLGHKIVAFQIFFKAKLGINLNILDIFKFLYISLSHIVKLMNYNF